MKSINFNINLFSLALMLIGIATSASAQSTENEAANEKDATVEIRVTGMTCAGCANNIYKVLSGTEGVIDNSIKYPGDIATVKYDPNKITPKQLIAAIEEETSYRAELVETKENN